MTNDKERARFEAWALSEGLNPIFTERTGYTTYTEHCAWRGWQAARAGLPSVEQIEEIINYHCEPFGREYAMNAAESIHRLIEGETK